MHNVAAEGLAQLTLFHLACKAKVTKFHKEATEEQDILTLQVPKVEFTDFQEPLYKLKVT